MMLSVMRAGVLRVLQVLVYGSLFQDGSGG